MKIADSSQDNKDLKGPNPVKKKGIEMSSIYNSVFFCFREIAKFSVKGIGAEQTAAA